MKKKRFIFLISIFILLGVTSTISYGNEKNATSSKEIESSVGITFLNDYAEKEKEKPTVSIDKSKDDKRIAKKGSLIPQLGEKSLMLLSGLGFLILVLVILLVSKKRN